MSGKCYAILIASSKFPEEPGLTELRCPENDVDALAEMLRSPDFGQFSEVVVFKNAPSYVVLERLETLLHEAGRENLVLVYFSGHGKLNASGQLCLATVNTKTASTGFQIAVEKKGDTCGLFTKHLVDGIRSGAADRDEDGLVDIHELYDHVYERVRAEGAQEPMKWDIHAKGRMIVAKSGKALREQRRQTGC